MHSCEQNSFFCFCVCQTYLSGSSVESHQEHGAAVAGGFLDSLSFVFGRPGPLNLLTFSVVDIILTFSSLNCNFRYELNCLCRGLVLHFVYRTKRI